MTDLPAWRQDPTWLRRFWASFGAGARCEQGHVLTGNVQGPTTAKTTTRRCRICEGEERDTRTAT